ncbi:MAG TPA: hypothetical protein VH593_25040, partial [Ktedonobacteraceae bacterium]
TFNALSKASRRCSQSCIMRVAHCSTSMIALGVHPIMKLVHVVQFSWWLASLLCFLLFATVEARTSYRPPGEQLLSRPGS